MTASTAHAVLQAKSRYSTIELARCKAAGPHSWQCDGLPGFPIYVSVGDDHRTYLSIGPRPQARRAARQSLASANTLFDGRSKRAAIEWRFVIRDKRIVPYATIVRYFTQDPRGKGEVVIVTRVSDTESCQVARIDALANADAMVAARSIADRQARSFDCRRDPMIVGVTGKSPM